MKNPCEKCIVKCICTKLCEDKHNYGRYLENKISNSKFFLVDIFIFIKYHTVKDNDEYKKYKNFTHLIRNHRLDEIEISNRRISCKYP